MTLAIGTALQNGNYVIDALGSEDSIGPVYLATHVPSGQWVMVRVLGSRHPERIPAPDQQYAFYQYLVNVSDLSHSLLPKRLRGFEEEGVCYQALALPPGAPLTQAITPQTPASLRHSLAITHQLIDALKALKSLGWAGITLTPDQLWQSADGKTFTFLGFDLPSSPPQPQDGQELAVVQGLTRLLYFLLTGYRAEETRAPLAVDVRQRRPELPMSLDRAFQWDFQASDSSRTDWLDEWRALLPSPAHLPEAVTASPQPVFPQPAVLPPQPLPTPELATVVASPVPVASASSAPTALSTLENSTTSRPQRGLPGLARWALLGTGLISALSGLTFGLQARLQLLGSEAPARFNPNQSFPPLPDWDGGASATDRLIPSQRQYVQPDYGSSPPVQATPIDIEQRPSIPVERVESSTNRPPTISPEPPLETAPEDEVESVDPMVEPNPLPRPSVSVGSEGGEEPDSSNPAPTPPVTPVAPAPINIQPAPIPAAPPAPLAPPAPVPEAPEPPTPLTSS